MDHLDVSTLPEDIRPVASWASSLLVALARDEAAGRRPARITEPGLGTWTRFRGRLTATDLLDLLFEDAAVLHRIPFDANALDAPLRLDALPAKVAAAWLETLPSLDLASPGADFILDQARSLGLPTRLARSELHAVKPHQKVLELPGTGGQLAHHLVSTQPDLTLRDNFTIACGTWQELTLAGLVALDLAAPSSDFVLKVDPAAVKPPGNALRSRAFDFVVGIHPDKGGPFRPTDDLAAWFSPAKIILV